MQNEHASGLREHEFADWNSVSGSNWTFKLDFVEKCELIMNIGDVNVQHDTWHDSIESLYQI